MSGAAPAETGLPSGWEIRHSRSRNLPYYFHAATSESRWEPPAGSDSDTLAAYMAVHHTPTAGGAAASTNSNARSAAGGSAGAAPQGKIRASHLLIKHKDSRRPSSWREVSHNLAPANLAAHAGTSYTDRTTQSRQTSRAQKTRRSLSCSSTSRACARLAGHRSARSPRPRATAPQRARAATSACSARARCSGPSKRRRSLSRSTNYPASSRPTAACTSSFALHERPSRGEAGTRHGSQAL